MQQARQSGDASMQEVAATHGVKLTGSILGTSGVTAQDLERNSASGSYVTRSQRENPANPQQGKSSESQRENPANPQGIDNSSGQGDGGAGAPSAPINVRRSGGGLATLSK